MTQLRKVLFPTRFDSHSLPSVRRLLALTKVGLEEIVLLFVVDRDEVAFVPFGGFDRKLADELVEHARLRLLDWEQEIREAGVACHSEVGIGRPAGKILEVAEREKVDLIVTGRQRHIGAEAVFLGSTSMEILRRTGVPVLVDRPAPEGAGEGAENAFDSLLFATDLTPASGPALEFVLALAGAAREVSVLHVIPRGKFAHGSVEEIRAEEERRLAQLEEICASLRKAGCDAAPRLRAGDVDTEILGAAKDCGARAIVLSTTEKDALLEFFLGSVSHRVAELSPVPVLLVPAR